MYRLNLEVPRPHGLGSSRSYLGVAVSGNAVYAHAHQFFGASRLDSSEDGNRLWFRKRVEGATEWKAVTLPKGFVPGRLQRGADGKVYVASSYDGYSDGELYRLDDDTDTFHDVLGDLRNALNGAPLVLRDFAVTPDGRTLYLYVHIYQNKTAQALITNFSREVWQVVDGIPERLFQAFGQQDGVEKQQWDIDKPPIQGQADVYVTPSGVYALPQYLSQIITGDTRHITRILLWAEGKGWRDRAGNLRNVLVNSISESEDGRAVLVKAGNHIYWRVEDQPWSRINTPEVREAGVSYILADPARKGDLYLGTSKGLFWTEDGVHWRHVLGEGRAENVLSLTYHPRWKVPLATVRDGLYFVVAPERNGSPWSLLRQWESFYALNEKKWWFWPATSLTGFVTAYITGMGALLFSAWRRGSTVFSRTWLASIAAKPLLMTPGIGRWALFLGYNQRLERLKAVRDAATSYFGLPAVGPGGQDILPEGTGENLHSFIGAALGPNQPVFIVGKGGSGKSTLLARWAHLAIKGGLSDSLRRFIPVLVTAEYYDGNLVEAIAYVLRERDGVAVDEKVVRAQMEAGGLLILFDGISEVKGAKQESLQEMLRTARNDDYRGCRFLFGSRAIEGMQIDDPMFRLSPLTPETVSLLLPLFGIGKQREEHVRRQLQSFGKRPIEPLLLAMAVEQSRQNEVSGTRAELYENYFRHLLRVERDQIHWGGWRFTLERLARRFMLDTGQRGGALSYEDLLEFIEQQNLVKVLREDYGVPVADKPGLVRSLIAAGIFQGDRSWRFAHDTFEEFFAASYIIQHVIREKQWPSLQTWSSLKERQQEFVDVISFVREMADEADDEDIWRVILGATMPQVWRSRLERVDSVPSGESGAA